jgi:hypothetical protein
MAIRAYLGDRRTGPRFQVNGQLWGSVDMREDVVVRNIAVNGALIEASLGPGMRSIRAAHITLPEGGPQLMVLVRHISALTDSHADDRHLLGVEFIKPTSADHQAIEAFVQAWNQRARPS